MCISCPGESSCISSAIKWPVARFARFMHARRVLSFYATFVKHCPCCAAEIRGHVRNIVQTLRRTQNMLCTWDTYIQFSAAMTLIKRGAVCCGCIWLPRTMVACGAYHVDPHRGDSAPPQPPPRRRQSPPRMSFKPPTYRPKVPPPPLFPGASATSQAVASQATAAPEASGGAAPLQGRQEQPPEQSLGQRPGQRRAPPSYATRRQGSTRASAATTAMTARPSSLDSQVLEAVLQEKNSWETEEKPLLEQQVCVVAYCTSLQRTSTRRHIGVAV